MPSANRLHHPSPAMSTPTPKNDGGPAFPRTRSTEYLSNSSARIESVGGMSLRDWFAGQALVGLLAHEDAERFQARLRVAKDENIRSNLLRARMSYELADAMLEARGEARQP